MTTATSNIVFDDIFTINAIDKEGKKFDRGSSTFPGSKMTTNQAPPHKCPAYMPIPKTTTWT